MKIFLQLIFVLLLVSFTALVASMDPGHVTLEWFNLRIETTALLLLLLMALVCFISMGLMRFLLLLAGLPAHVRHWRDKRQWSKKEATWKAAHPVTPSTTDVIPPTKKPTARGKK